MWAGNWRVSSNGWKQHRANGGLRPFLAVLGSFLVVFLLFFVGGFLVRRVEAAEEGGREVWGAGRVLWDREKASVGVVSPQSAHRGAAQACQDLSEEEQWHRHTKCDQQHSGEKASDDGQAENFHKKVKRGGNWKSARRGKIIGLLPPLGSLWKCGSEGGELTWSLVNPERKIGENLQCKDDQSKKVVHFWVKCSEIACRIAAFEKVEGRMQIFTHDLHMNENV